MDSAAGIADQKIGNGRIGAEGFEQLDLAVGQVDEDDADAMFGLRHGRRNLGAQRLGIECRRGRQIRHGNGDMVQSSDHGCPTWFLMGRPADWACTLRNAGQADQMHVRDGLLAEIGG